MVSFKTHTSQAYVAVGPIILQYTFNFDFLETNLLLNKIYFHNMLYFQVSIYIGSRLLLSYHYLQLIPDICRTGLVLGTSSQFVILLVYNFSSCILGIGILFSDHLQIAYIVPIFLLVSGMCLIRTV